MATRIPTVNDSNEFPESVVAAIKESLKGDIATASTKAAWENVTGKPSTFSPTIGTTASTAAAGNHKHSYNDLSDKPTIPADQSAAVSALETRVNALENASTTG